PGNQRATVTWQPPGDDGGSAIVSYVVQAFQGGTIAFGTPVVTSGASTSATVTGLTNGQPYGFTVTAANAVASGSASILTNMVSPQAPTLVGLAASLSPSFVGARSTATLSFAPPQAMPASSLIVINLGGAATATAPVTVSGIAGATARASGSLTVVVTLQGSGIASGAATSIQIGGLTNAGVTANNWSIFVRLSDPAGLDVAQGNAFVNTV